jgi:DNA sulfur modification protein DndE
MSHRIKTSESNKEVVKTLTNKYEFKDERTIGQIAIAYSLQVNKRFDLEKDLPSDNNGKEYPETLLGEINNQSNDIIYKIIFNQHYGWNISEEEFYKLLKLHIDHGLELLKFDLLSDYKGKNSHIDFLLNIIDRGVGLINKPAVASQAIKSTIRSLGAYTGLLEVELGIDLKTDELVKIRINDENEFDSQHFAVAGMNGSGKTQLIQDILFQLNQQSSGQLKFIFLDYKGEGKSDKLKRFLTETNCDFIDIKENPLKFNPLTAISLPNNRDRISSIKAFRDKLTAIDKRIGAKQKNNLEIVIQNCFEKSTKSGRHPSMIEVYNELIKYYEESSLKEDTLTSIFKDLADVVFDHDFDPNFNINERNLYVNLPTSLPDAARKASVFLILNYLLGYYIDSNDVIPSDDRIKPIRYVIVIDEAHAYLKEKNMVEVLEGFLRMIRSKGVIIMMLSQGVEEYKQKDFDFSSQIKIPILLNIQNKDIKLAKSFLGTPKSEVPLRDALNNLTSGKAVINFDEPKLIEINQFWQRFK